jgi:hypothetical protein
LLHSVLQRLVRLGRLFGWQHSLQMVSFALSDTSTHVECTGCDALSVHLITAQMAGTLALGSGPLVVIGTLAIMIPWLAAQWEEYHTGLMLCVALPPPTTSVMRTERNMSSIFLDISGNKPDQSKAGQRTEL